MPGASVRIDPRALNLEVDTDPAYLHAVDLPRLVSQVVLPPGARNSLYTEFETC